MKNKIPRRHPFIRNMNHYDLYTHQKTKSVTMGNHLLLPLINEDTERWSARGSDYRLLTSFQLRVHIRICISEYAWAAFNWKKNFASCDKALTKTVTWALSDEEVEFPFSTERLRSPEKSCQVFLLALWASVSLSNNHLKQNQFRPASLGTGAHCDRANNFCFPWGWGGHYTGGWGTRDTSWSCHSLSVSLSEPPNRLEPKISDVK